MNMLHTIDQRRVRLRIRPLTTVSMPEGKRGFAIEVTNLSSFPVTVDEVGFEIDRRNIAKNPRASVAYPELYDGKPWPRRLEPRENVSVHLRLQDMEIHRGRKIGRAYAKTACDEVGYGGSPALTQLRNDLKAILKK